MVLEVEVNAGGALPAAEAPEPVEVEKKQAKDSKKGKAPTTDTANSNKKKSSAAAAPTTTASQEEEGDTSEETTTTDANTTSKPQPQAQQPQQQQQQQQQQPPQRVPFQAYPGVPQFNQIRSTNLQDFPPGRGWLTFTRPCPSNNPAHLAKLEMLQNCPQILGYIQSFSGADWMEATFNPQPCIRITATTQMPGGRATAEAILRLSDEMVLQWMHLFDPSMPVWAMFVCPSLLSGLMVGKLACNVKQIEQVSQARVWAAPRDTSAQYVSFFICSNNPDATRAAYSMLEARAHQQMQSLGPPAGMMGMPAPAAVTSPAAAAAAGAAAAGEGVPSTATTAPATATKKKDSQGGKTKDKSSAKKEKEPKEKETTSPSSSSCSSSTTTTPATSDDDASSTDTEPSTQQPSRAASASPPATNKGENPGSPKGGALTRDASSGGESANHQSASPVKASANATDSKKNGSVEIKASSSSASASSAGASKKKAGKAAAAAAAVAATSAENANEEIVAEAAAEVSN